MLDASIKGDLPKIKQLISDSAEIHYLGDQPFHEAVFFGHLDCAQYFLENGVDVGSKDHQAIRQASANGDRDMVELLISHGADVQSQNNQALRRAVEAKSLSTVDYLLKNGADASDNKATALRYASRNDLNKILESLIGSYKMPLTEKDKEEILSTIREEQNSIFKKALLSRESVLDLYDEDIGL